MGRKTDGPVGWALSDDDEKTVDSMVRRGGRDVQNILVETFDRRVQALDAHDLVRRRGESAATQPCIVSQADLIRFEHSALPHLPAGGELVALSPVTPLGATSTLTGLSHKTVLSTIRGTEVVSDAVIPLTLEMAERSSRIGSAWQGATLATFHREIRMQKFSSPEFTPHFHALSLVSAAATNDYETFMHNTLAAHVRTYLRILESSRDLGYEIDRISVRVSNLRVVELLLKSRGRDQRTLPRRSAARGVQALAVLEADLPSAATGAQLADLLSSSNADVALTRKPLAFLSRLTDAVAATLEPGAVPVDLTADLGRHAGLGYYQDLCVKISATTADGTSFDLIDIGSNDWLSSLTGSRRDRLVTGGMGTETFLRYFRARR